MILLPGYMLRLLLIVSRMSLSDQGIHLLGGELLIVPMESALLLLLRLLLETLGRVVWIPRHAALQLIVRINVRAPPSGILTDDLPSARNSAGASWVPGWFR